MNSTAILRARVFRAIVAPMILDLACCSTTAARNYLFENISDLPAGPGGGRSAEINDDGDVVFLNGGTVWFYDGAAKSFLPGGVSGSGASSTYRLVMRCVASGGRGGSRSLQCWLPSPCIPRV